MEGEKASTIICTLVAIDNTSFCYRVCSICERILPDNSTSGDTSFCGYCNFNALNPNSGSKRLFRILMSIASDRKVFVVICFDRAARVLFGCSADDFFDFAKLHPFAGNFQELQGITLNHSTQIFPSKTVAVFWKIISASACWSIWLERWGRIFENKNCSWSEVLELATFRAALWAYQLDGFCVTAGKLLEGEMFRMKLSKPKNGNAEHLRVASVVPLRSGFQPVIETLRERYGVAVVS